MGRCSGRGNLSPNSRPNGQADVCSPFCTDPDCARVRNMVKGYASAGLEDVNDFFGDITIYMK